MTTANKPFSAEKMALRTAIILFVFVVVFTALLSAVYLWTKPTIDEAARQETLNKINEVLPASQFDNNLLDTKIVLPAAELLGQDSQSTAYLAKKGDSVKAVVLEAIAPDGYGGPIKIILAIDKQGILQGVRVTAHNETPGLGDYIDPKKDKNKVSPWIHQFNLLDTNKITAQDWKVHKDGGHFDSIAGATVSPRAVVKAIGKAIQYVQTNHERLFSPQLSDNR